MSFKEIKRAAIIGLGKLGSPMVAVFASRGLEVIGVDTDPAKVAALQRGEAPVYEPQLQEMLTGSQEHYTATLDGEAAVLNSDATFLIVPTPSEQGGGFSLRYVLPACEMIGRALRRKDDFHLVVLTSTVMPGATDDRVRAALEQASGKKCGVDFGLCYSPEFIAIGSVIRDFLKPDFVLVGESDTRSGDLLASVYKQVCDNDPPVARMNFVNAELCKISVNTYVTTKITFANMIAGICERLPDADVDVVTGALGLDTRIGKRYLKGALGYGGPCFPRDNVALGALARAIGASSTLADATDRANDEVVERMVNLAKSYLPKGGSVGVLGLSYKENTGVVEESQGLQIAQALLAEGIPVNVYDPLAISNARRELSGPVTYAVGMHDCALASDVILVTTPWPEFKNLEPAVLEREGTRRVVIDCWRMLDRTRLEAFVDYVPVGVGLVNSNEAAVAVSRPVLEQAA